MGGEKMQTKFFCDLYVSEGWEKKKLKLIKKLQKNKLQPSVYVITLSQGKQNHLEYYSSLLLKQHIFDNASLFIVGIANEKGLLINIDIARADLPTITSINKDFYEISGNYRYYDMRGGRPRCGFILEIHRLRRGDIVR